MEELIEHLKLHEDHELRVEYYEPFRMAPAETGHRVLRCLECDEVIWEVD